MPPQTRSQSKTASPAFRLSSISQPPLYQINLSAPPKERYSQICSDYKTKLAHLIPLYNDVLSLTPFPRLCKVFAKLLLRTVYSKEENDEITGISEAVSIPKHLVVAFNVFLDLFSGCVSGGARVVDSGPTGKSNGVVHFRGLDWGMDILRSLTICVEYVRDGQVVARGVTYAGYVGVLTGVREGLSMSLNYRPTPASSLPYLHYLRLLLGQRPSNSSQLRQLLLSNRLQPASSSMLQAELSKYPSSPCYMTFCTTESIVVFERGLTSTSTHTSDTFLTVTNHDVDMESWDDEQWKKLVSEQAPRGDTGVRDVVADSVMRKECVCSLKEKHGRANLRVKDVVDWLQVKPVLNECTHYSCVMDPSVPGGGLLWVRMYEEPITMDDPSLYSSEESG